jgi:hypothetical protein
MLARKCGKSMTLMAIANESGLSRRTVIRISQCMSWDGIKVDAASRFMNACGIDPFSAKFHLDFLRKTIQCETPLSHIRDQRVRRRLEQVLGGSPPAGQE